MIVHSPIISQNSTVFIPYPIRVISIDTIITQSNLTILIKLILIPQIRQKVFRQKIQNKKNLTFTFEGVSTISRFYKNILL